MNLDKKIKLDMLQEKYAEKLRWKVCESMISRDNIVKYIDEISNLWLPVKRVSWRCKCIDIDKSLWCPHGAWWPWFEWGHYWEMYRADFDFEFDNSISVFEHNNKVKESILNKKIYDRDGNILTFYKNKCLTPSIITDYKYL